MNQRGWFKCDNIETIEFNNVTMLHDETSGKWTYGPHFISCGHFIATDCDLDSYPVIFSVNGIQTMTLTNCNFGVNEPIRRMIDIGPQSGVNRLLTTLTDVTIRDCTASNITRDEALYLKTDGQTVNVDIDGLTLNFNAGTLGNLALENGNVNYVQQENIIINIAT